MPKNFSLSGDMCHESVRTVLIDVLGIRHIPIELNFLQIEHRKEVTQDILERINSEPTITEHING